MHSVFSLIKNNRIFSPENIICYFSYIYALLHPKADDYVLHEKLEFEKEVTGLYISGHPFDGCEEAIGRFTNCSIADLPRWQGRTAPRVGGILLSASEKTTKKGAVMGQLLLEDSNSSIEMVAFPRVWESVKAQVQVGAPFVVEGRMGDREPKNFIVERLTPLSEAEDAGIVRIRLKVNLVPQALNVRDFARALRDCRGASPVLLEFQDDRDACVVYLNDFRVDPSVPGRLQSRLAEVVPLEALEVVC